MFILAEAIGKENNLPKEEFERIHKLHVEFVQEAVRNGQIIFGGPKADAPGGFLLVKAQDMEEAKMLLDTDPMVINNLQYFNLNQWIILDKAVEI